MDVRRADQAEATIEHEGTCLTYFFYEKGSLIGETSGTFLEFVAEFELAPGRSLDPHRHNSHEYYYVLRGQARMTIERESRDVGPGDLIHIPPNAEHSIASTSADQPFRGFSFAAMFPTKAGKAH
jgi:quercetin dioxygenase-like cupin family protein